MSRVETSEFQTNRRILLKKYDKCELCGDTRGIEVHHKIPLSVDGDDTIDNLIVVCGKCHAILHSGTRKILQRAGIKRTQDKERLRKKALSFYEFIGTLDYFDVCKVCDYLDEKVFELSKSKGAKNEH